MTPLALVIVHQPVQLSILLNHSGPVAVDKVKGVTKEISRHRLNVCHGWHCYDFQVGIYSIDIALFCEASILTLLDVNHVQ